MADEKAKYFVGVCYPENMLEDWQEQIYSILQIPFAYCVHDKDKNSDDDKRKVHVHIMLCFSNTTTKKHCIDILNKLSKVGCFCCSDCQVVNGVRYMYDYLIHDTNDARKKHKHLYDKSERILGNNFDIGCYEQLSMQDKIGMCSEIKEFIKKYNVTNYLDLYDCIENNFGYEFLQIVIDRHNFFDKLCKGQYLKTECQRIKELESHRANEALGLPTTTRKSVTADGN